MKKGDFRGNCLFGLLKPFFVVKFSFFVLLLNKLILLNY